MPRRAAPIHIRVNGPGGWYYVEWHLREAWAPILFHDHERAEAESSAYRPWPPSRSRPPPSASAEAVAAMTSCRLPALATSCATSQP